MTTFKDLVERLASLVEHGGPSLRQFVITFAPALSGRGMVAEVRLDPHHPDPSLAADESFARLLGCLPDTYVPYSGAVPGRGQARGGRIDVGGKSVSAVAVPDGQYDEVYPPDLESWASGMREQGYTVRVVQ